MLYIPAVGGEMNDTVHAAFARAAAQAPQNRFLSVPPSASQSYAPEGVSLTYDGAFAEIEALRARYRAAGYGRGHRVALLLENRPAFLVHWLALNGLGASVVPVNPFYRADELAYLLDHSDSVLAVAIAGRVDELARAGDVPVVAAEDAAIPAAPPPRTGPPGAAGECALLYTSGTTGRPKGCILSNAYFRRLGEWYVGQGGVCAVRHGAERLLTPLPLFHMNAMACSFMAMVLSHGCLVLLDRFHPSSWWSDIAATGATIVHYLGVMPAILLAREADAAERAHPVRFGFGANVDPAHQQAFHDRFGFPLIEGWAMTETGAGAIMADSQEPRLPGARCVGRPAGCEVRIVDDEGGEAPDGVAGEMLVRHAGPDPRAGFFSGYYKDAEATEAAWRGGWFHTGDLACRAADGRIHFVDRKRNVIRRSDENIAALEVETVLQDHNAIADVAVIAVPDESRGEEVMACVVAAPGVVRDAATARDIADRCRDRLAYYKAPGYVLFLDALPVTATNKVRKTTIREIGGDPRRARSCFDLRAMKRPGD